MKQNRSIAVVNVELLMQPGHAAVLICLLTMKRQLSHYKGTYKAQKAGFIEAKVPIYCKRPLCCSVLGSVVNIEK